MKKVDTEFEQLVFDGYGQEDGYDSIRHKLFRIKEIMANSHKDFKEFPVKKQFDYCITIGCIVLHSTIKDLRKISIIRKDKDEVFKYSIDEGYVPPTQITIRQNKKLTR